jgi:hypothetical protein
MEGKAAIKPTTGGKSFHESNIEHEEFGLLGYNAM